MPEVVRDLHHLRVGPSLSFTTSGPLERRALQVAYLGHDDHFLAPDFSARHELSEHGADQPLARSRAVVAGGVDQVAPFVQGFAKRLPVFWAGLVDAIAAKAEAAHAEAGVAESGVARRAVELGVVLCQTRRCAGRRVPGQRLAGDLRQAERQRLAFRRLDLPPDVVGREHGGAAGEVAADVERSLA